MPPSESAKLRALRAKNVLMFQRVLRAYIPTCLACLRAHVSTCLACWCANVLCVFTCQRVFRAYVQSALRVLVLTWQCPLRAYMLTCPRTLRALPANWQSALRAHVQKVSTVKFFFCPVFYQDEKTLLIKVEARRVTNASRHDGSCKILISQIILGFIISLINNRYFIDVEPVKHIRSSFLQKY